MEALIGVKTSFISLISSLRDWARVFCDVSILLENSSSINLIEFCGESISPLILCCWLGGELPPGEFASADREPPFWPFSESWVMFTSGLDSSMALLKAVLGGLLFSESADISDIVEGIELADIEAVEERSEALEPMFTSEVGVVAMKNSG